jgi:hypothetical protein
MSAYDLIPSASAVVSSAESLPAASVAAFVASVVSLLSLSEPPQPASDAAIRPAIAIHAIRFDFIVLSSLKPSLFLTLY